MISIIFSNQSIFLPYDKSSPSSRPSKDYPLELAKNQYLYLPTYPKPFYFSFSSFLFIPKSTHPPANKKPHESAKGGQAVGLLNKNY
ncbi:MAG: hypothetical protein QF771_02425, partial [Candidatus Marinimicrobia bacterium]|nr:hypothetical protein [Candidatus Neomarinimicrobiota bacterium]